jgi:hypothetical protein
MNMLPGVILFQSDCFIYSSRGCSAALNMECALILITLRGD